MHSAIELLEEIRSNSGERICDGLNKDEIERFLKLDENLAIAIEEASERRLMIESEFGSDFLHKSEHELISHSQEDFVNFYYSVFFDKIHPILLIRLFHRSLKPI